MPDHNYLESWGDAEAKSRALLFYTTNHLSFIQNPPVAG
jgi:hypothetical protein